MTWVKALVVLILSSTTCLAEPSLTLDQLQFDGWIGKQRQGDQTEFYVPLGIGYLFQTPQSDDAEQVIATWIADHPKAVVTVVDRELVSTRLPKIYFSYVWVQDQDENLNLTLVREGVFPAWLMIDAVEATQMTGKSDLADAYSPQRLVTDVEYAVFIKQTHDAEAAARRDRKGVWSDAYTDRRKEWHLE
jgi:hypothetical protein